MNAATNKTGDVVTNAEQTTFLSIVGNDYPSAYLPPPGEGVHITKVHIKNFKKIDDATVDLITYSVLTGINNSGKSTVLQAVWVAFECLRLCVDRGTWQIADTGRALAGFDFLPANEPEDLWNMRRFRQGNAGRPITIKVELSDGFFFETQINFYFGAINVKVTDWNKAAGVDGIKNALSLSPMLIPGHVEIGAHEESKVPAQIHRYALSGQLSSIIRNVLLNLSEAADKEPNAKDVFHFRFVAEAIKHHFEIELSKLKFDPERDLEIRAPYSEKGSTLDIVSAGSGLHQILKLAAFIAWRKSRIVLLDEPDAHLHTSLQTRLAGFLQELCEKSGMQIILATHSRDLIARSPIESIIPVDTSAKEIRPIAHIDHLLLEYRRLGAVNNMDIALLYQTKNCLFVEGASDSAWIPSIAAKLGKTLFTGADQFVVFEFKGVEKFTMVADLAALFEKVIGGKINWFVLRDRDSSPPQVLAHLNEMAKKKGVQNFHIWTCYSIENLLLDHTLVTTTVQAKAQSRKVAVPGQDQIEKALEEAADKVFPDVRSDFIAATQSYYLRHSLGGDNPREQAIKDALAYLDACKTLDGKLTVLPGSKVFGQFVQVIQNRFGLTITVDDLIENLTEGNTPKELKALLDELEAVRKKK